MKRTALVLAAGAILAAPISAQAAAAPTKNIVQTAVAAGNFKTLVKLVKAAGLAETLSGKTNYTVFAPTDAAFKKVPKATLDALGADPAALKRVLLYHVVPGKVTAAKVVTLKSAKTAAGPKVTITVTGKTVRVNKAKVIAVDVLATNGVIHVIDTVLIPPSK